MTTEIDDPELQRHVERLLLLARVEVSLRGALMAQGPSTRRDLDLAVQSALRTFCADPQLRNAIRYLRRYQRGLSRRRSASNALEELVAERRATRLRVDARAAEIGTTVPPLQWKAPTLRDEEHVQVDQLTDALFEEHGGLDGIDAALKSPEVEDS